MPCIVDIAQATTRLGSTLRRFRRQPWSHKTFEHGTWGDKLILMGLIAHTCVEATVRYAAELGYEVTIVKDATADYSDEEMHAALDVNIPNYASAIVKTDEVVHLISVL